MKQITKNTIKALAVCQLLGASEAKALPLPQVSGKLTEFAGNEKVPASRQEIFVNRMPINSDVYILRETSGGNNFYMLRAQTIPLEYRSMGLGVAAQSVEGSNFKRHRELGLVGRVKGVHGTANIRYFPETNTADTYSSASVRKFAADLLGSYNTKTGSIMLRPGIDVKVRDNTKIGLELGASGKKPSKIERRYTGARISLGF